MSTKFLFTAIFFIALIPNAFAQQRPDGPPPREGRHRDWMKGIDTDRDGIVETDEFQSALERTFADLDKDGDGAIEADEVPRGSRPGRSGPPPIPRGDRMNGQPPRGDREGPRDAFNKLPPFFFMERLRDTGTLNKLNFERAVRDVFGQMDSNSDGSLTREESRPPNDRGAIIEERVGPPPNAMFIAAELRFGDKLVKNAPFSAETVIEDTRRLFDGTTVTKTSKGAFYRDSAGRTRREQPLEMIGGFSIANEKNKPQTLVFINDFAARTQYFFDLNNSIARKIGIGPDGPPRDEPQRPGAKSETLGTKTIEGISVEGTRTTFELPAGHIGNDKPIQVVTENWFSLELQAIVMSRHLDPLSGEHVFRLVNIRRSEPAVELFAVPASFRVEGKTER